MSDESYNKLIKAVANKQGEPVYDNEVEAALAQGFVDGATIINPIAGAAALWLVEGGWDWLTDVIGGFFGGSSVDYNAVSAAVIANMQAIYADSERALQQAWDKTRSDLGLTKLAYQPARKDLADVAYGATNVHSTLSSFLYLNGWQNYARNPPAPKVPWIELHPLDGPWAIGWSGWPKSADWAKTFAATLTDLYMVHRIVPLQKSVDLVLKDMAKQIATEVNVRKATGKISPITDEPTESKSSLWVPLLAVGTIGLGVVYWKYWRTR